MAWSDIKLSGTALGLTVSTSSTKTGLAAGGGAEWMFANRWSVKAEYLYIDTGNTTVTFAGVPVTGRFKDNVARIGLNYHL